MEGESPAGGAWVVTGVEMVVMVVKIVVGCSDSVTIVVERIVSVTGGIVIGGSVMVFVESLVTTSVFGGAESPG